MQAGSLVQKTGSLSLLLAICGLSSAYLLSVVQSPLVRKRRLIGISLAELSGTPNPFPVSISEIDTHRHRQNIPLFHRGSCSIFPQGAQRWLHLSRQCPLSSSNWQYFHLYPWSTRNLLRHLRFRGNTLLGLSGLSFFCFLLFQVSEAQEPRRVSRWLRLLDKPLWLYMRIDAFNVHCHPRYWRGESGNF